MAKQQKRADASRMYAYQVEDFNVFYPMVTVCVAVACIVAVIIALLWKIFAGVLTFAVACAAYYTIMSWKVYNTFGMRYGREGGGIVANELICLSKDCIIVPRALMWTHVEQIADGAFDREENRKVKTVYVPSTVKYIGTSDLLPHCEILYEGSREDWERIEKKVEIPASAVSFLVRHPGTPSHSSVKSGGKR